ncbi:unnamed protein product [marine sediment metagenome]|uniref:Uncharacterized protein n=1 Tax=marine sediment metagenome TaxID=412755 RepID=X1HA69_9ZZZZ
MIIVQFTPDELRVLHDVLSDIIENVDSNEWSVYPPPLDTHIFEFSDNEFDCLHKFRNAISQFLD